MLRDSTVVVVRTRPRAIPLPMITMRKSVHGFFSPIWLWGSAWRPFGPPELRYSRERVSGPFGIVFLAYGWLALNL